MIDNNKLHHHTLGNFWTTAKAAETEDGVKELFDIVAKRVYDYLTKDRGNE